MEQHKDINSAKNFVRELKKARDIYKADAGNQRIEINLDRANLSEKQVGILNRRMPALIGVLNGNATTYQLQCGFAKLPGLYLHEAYLRGADLASTDLSTATLTRAELSNSNLRAADLRGADLRDANFEGAYIRKTRFNGSDRHGAQLEGAVPSLFDSDRMFDFQY